MKISDKSKEQRFTVFMTALSTTSFPGSTPMAALSRHLESGVDPGNEVALSIGLKAKVSLVLI